MPNYRRWRVPGAAYFFEVNLWNRRRALLVDRIDDLREAVRSIRADHPFHIDAMVVLPDHLHCVWTLPLGETDYSIRWKLIKAKFSRDIPGIEGLSRSRQQRGERGIWQRRFWEHTIRDDDDYAHAVDYVHINPVKHRLVASPRDWPYSSIHDHIRRGILPPDWNGPPEGFDWDVWWRGGQEHRSG